MSKSQLHASTFIVDVANAVSSSVMCSTILWKPDNTTLAYKLLADDNVTFHDVLKRSVAESSGFCTNENWLEHHFSATETCGANRDDVSVWELIGLLLVSRFELHTNVAQFLCDIPRASRNVQDHLGSHVRGGHDERHALSVSLGDRGQNGMLFKRNLEFVVELRMPDFSPEVHIRDDTAHDQRWRQARRSGRPAFVSRPGLAAPQPPSRWAWSTSGGRLGTAPKSPRHERSNTHLSKDALSQNGNGRHVTGP